MLALPSTPPRVVVCTCQWVMFCSQPRGDSEGRSGPARGVPTFRSFQDGKSSQGNGTGSQPYKMETIFSAFIIALVDFTRALWAVMLITH